MEAHERQKPGRKPYPAGRKRSVSLMVRLTPDESDALKKAASAVDTEHSTFARELILRGIS